MARFAIVIGGMVVLLALALRFGGIWPGLALLYMTVFTYFMDKIAALAAPDAPAGQEFPSGHGLSLLIGCLHFPLLYGGVYVLARGDLGTAEAVLTFAALGLYLGQVSNANAHELIHQPGRAARRLGVAVYCSVLFGHHASAHRLVHHVHAATARDPNSARLGEGFYRFALRAWVGSFRAGWRAETARRERQAQGVHPYAVYVAGAGASVLLALWLGGGSGLAWLLALAGYAQAQLLLSDYVQHYGLRRRALPDGKPEPVGPQHSWNAPQGFSSALLLNAPRHSDHHARPARAYPGLELDRAAMPLLPHALPVMAVLALAPPVWRRLMDRRARGWSDFRQV